MLSDPLDLRYFDYLYCLFKLNIKNIPGIFNKRNAFFRGFACLIVPWIAVVLLREIGPLIYPPTSDMLKWFIFNNLVISSVFFLIGFFIVPATNAPKSNLEIVRYVRSQRQIYNLFLVVAIGYIALSLVDFFLMKAGDITRLVEIRESENETGPRNSVVGLIVALLSAAPALLVVCMISGPEKSSGIKWLARGVAIAGLGCSFLTGGRNSFFLSVGYVFAYWFIFKFGQSSKVRVDSSRIMKLFVSLAFIFAVIFSLRIFLDRFALQGMSPLVIIEHYERNYLVEFKPLWFQNELLISIYVSMALFSFYLTHSMSYLDIVISRGHDLLYGAYNFPIPYRIVDYVFMTDFFGKMQEDTIGVYLSFPGSLYLDFSYFGAIIGTAFIAIIFGYLFRQRATIGFNLRLVASLVLLIILFSPFYSVIALGNGFSYLFLIFIASLNFRNRYRV